MDNPEKIEFEKAYTRDITVVIEQAWCKALEDHRDELGFAEYQDQPLVVNYLHDGVVEVWENTNWTPALMDAMLAKNMVSDRTFLEQTQKHQDEVEYLQPFWEKGFTSDADELITIVNRVSQNMHLFDWMYYPALDERTPKAIRDVALKMRDADVYFDKTDQFIRKSLIAMYPHLKGYEQGILNTEIANPPTVDVLRERNKDYIIASENKTFSGTLDEYQAQNPDLHFNIETPPSDASTLVGQTANKGYAKGVVRILKRKEQIDEVQDGEIIVSAMTTPDFVPAMKKCAAIVTDEGGITCHATIVSRELNKPCVIGTKFATQVLKDGDMVEVDADNGTVKKI